MGSTCTSCQAFLGAGQANFCENCLPRNSRRCQGCRVVFERDGDKFCKACRQTDSLFPELVPVSKRKVRDET